ncbi:MAG: peptidylprolyl isomerase [Acidimicrobiia bacterium]
MPETLPQLPRVTTHPQSPPPGGHARTARSLVAILGVLAIVLAACSSSSPAALTVGSRTVDETTVKEQLDAIATNKDLKAQVATAGKIKPEAAATWITQLVPMELAQGINEKAGTKITKADQTAAKDWANGVFGQSAFSAFPSSFKTKVINRYASIPAYIRTHTKVPTETQLKTAYAQGLQQNCPSRRYVSQILVATEATAKDLAAQIANGGNFATIARANSTDTQSAQVGGAYGCLESQQTAPIFAGSAAAVPVGQVSAPVQLSDGWHIIKVQDVEEVINFEKVKPEIVTQLRGQEGRSKLNKLVTAAKVKVASKYGHWVVKNGQGTVEPPKASSSTTSTRAPSSGSTTTTKP